MPGHTALALIVLGAAAFAVAERLRMRLLQAAATAVALLAAGLLVEAFVVSQSGAPELSLWLGSATALCAVMVSRLAEVGAAGRRAPVAAVVTVEDDVSSR